MPAMTATAFADFFYGTRETYLKDGKAVNLTGYQRYLLSQFTKGKGDAEVIQGGDAIMVNLQVSAGPGSAQVSPGDTVDRQAFNGLTQAKADWRFTFGSVTWTSQEIELNKGGKVQILNLADQKRKMHRQGVHESMEKLILADPDYASMEAVGAVNPYSVPCFITDDGNLPAGFATLMGINHALWKNPFAGFTQADLATLIVAMDSMYLTLDFDEDGVGQEWTDGTKWDKFIIATDKIGRNLISAAIRTSQGSNVFVTNNGGDIGALAAKAMYNGIPIRYIPELDAKAWAKTKYYLINTQFLHPVYHSTFYMREKEPRESERQPNVWYADTDTWWNFVCTDRRRSGVLVGA